MKKNKKLLSILLALVLLLSLLPLTSMAAAADTDTPAEETTEPAAEPDYAPVPADTEAPAEKSAAPADTDTPAEETTEPAAEPDYAPVPADTEAPAEKSAAPEDKGTKSGEAFTTQPTNFFKTSNRSFSVSWATSFTPVKVEIGSRFGDDDFYIKATITDGLSASMSHDLILGSTYLPVGKYMYIRAYYGNGSSNYIESAAFALDWDSVKFTMQPINAFKASNNSFSVSWATSFTPVKVEIGSRYSTTDDLNVIATITDGLSTSMSHDLLLGSSYLPDGNYMYIRAYYGDGSSNYIESAVFALDWDSVRFTSQPTAGKLATGGGTMASWATSFTPVKVEIGTRYSATDDFNVKATITDGLSTSMSYALREASTYWPDGNYMYIRAYYGDYYYIESEAFGVERVYDYHFTTKPAGGTVGPEETISVYWATDFTPVKAVIGWESDGGAWIEVASVTTGLSSNMSYPLPYDSAINGTMILRVFFDGRSFVESSFEITKAALSFTSDPTGGTIGPDGSMTLAWTTNFTPTRVEIGYMVSNSWVHTVTLTSGLQKHMSCPLTYDDAYNGKMYVRAYSGSTYVDSPYFTVTKTPRQFTVSPAGGTVNPESSLTLSWTTNFVPTLIEIGFLHDGVWSTTDYISSGLNKSMSRSLTYDLLNETTYIRAYYDGAEYVLSSPIPINKVPRQFTVSPAGGTVNPESSLTLSWTTNFVPTLIEIGFLHDGVWSTTDYISSGLNKSMSRSLTYDLLNETTYIRAYYDGAEYVLSSPIPINKVPRQFTTQPAGGTVNPESSLTLSWKTNFTPTMVQIGWYNSSGDWVPQAEITTGLNKSMSYPLPYGTAINGAMYVRAFTGNNYVESAWFAINKVPRQFTTQPAGGTVNPDGSLSLSWKANFTPVRVLVGYYYAEGSFTSNISITTGLNKNMTYALAYDDANNGYDGKMYVRAYYDSTHFVESSGFTVEKVARQFTAQPTGGTVYPWRTLSLSWTTNYTPVKVEIGYMSGSNWVLKDTVTSNLKKSMTYDLDYDHAATAVNWKVRVFFSDNSTNYVQSNSFGIDKRAAYKCGDNLTATLEDGALILSGTGAMYDYSRSQAVPWYPDRSSITSVVIPDGVTYIGNWAFGYLNIYEASFTPSVTSIGSYAFYGCSALRYVSFDGFRAQWEDLDLVSGSIGNDALESAAILYLYRSGTVSGSVYYQLNGATGQLLIYGSGGSTVHVTPPWAAWAQYITKIEVQGLDTIWEEAFRDCTGVKTVYLDDCLTLVDDMAFNDCTALTDVYYSSTLSDWNAIDIDAHNDPLLDATLHTVAHEAQLTDDLSWSVDDTGLLRIWVDDSLMGSGEELGIPDFTNYTNTPWYADYKDMITALRVESGVTSIGRNAFGHLTKLSTIKIADSVTIIGNYSFAYCTSLEDFTLPNSVTRILAYTFQNCTYLEQIHLPDSIQSMGIGVFQNCYNLEKVWLPSQITNIQKNTFYNCSLLDMVSIPATVTSIGDNAFYGCTELASSTGHVYYDGTSAQWADVTVNTGNNNLSNAGIIHFNPEELRIDAVNFPDAQFRAYVSDNFDTDGSGWLTDAEIAAADIIDDEDNDYASLEGIEFFPNLTGILLDAAPSLTSVDLNANTKLLSVDFSGNENLATIHLEGLLDLAYLFLSGTAVETLDLTGLTSLGWLSVSDTPLAALDLSDQSLKELYVYNTELTELDLSGQTVLRKLYCYGTNITSLDLHNSPELLNTVLNGTQTVTADYVQYRIDSNHLLRVDPNTTLIGPEGICINAANFPDEEFRNYVKYRFDTSGNGWLTDDEIEAATAISMDGFDGFYSVKGIEYFTELTSLELTNDPDLTGADLSANTKLTYVDFSCSGLTALNVSMLPALEKLWCDNNPLTSLTLGSQQALKTLTCYGTDLTELDISGCPLLLDAYLNGSRTENEDYVEYENGSNTLCVDAGTEIVTEAIDANLKFAARSITLQDNLQVNYKVNRAVIDDGGYTDPYVVFNMNGNEVRVTGTLDTAGTYYVFSFRNIAPHRINDDFTATLYATLDGELHEGVTLSYSISQYCYNQLNKLSSQSEFATLLVDLLNYGAQSQIYTGYNTGNLANAQLTATQASWGTTTEPTYTTVQNTKYETVEDPLVTWTALGLYLEDTVSIRLKLAVADTTGLTIKVRDDNGHTWSYGASALKATGDQYYFYFSGLNADQMRETVYITAYKNGAAVSNTVRYSIESYCYAKQKDTTLKDILSAMMKYGDSAYNYVN